MRYFVNLGYSLTLFVGPFGGIRTIEELSVEKLDPNHGEDEQEEHIHDQDIEHILQGSDHAIKHSL